MDYSTMGQMGQYMKNLGLSAKWEKKKNTGDLLNKESHLKINFKTEHEQERESMLPIIEEMRANKDEDLNRIMAKVQAGSDLTPAEKEYLKKKSPTTYDAVKRAEMEKKAYKEDLKRCKTKEDVQKIKVPKMAQHLSTVKSIMSNPHIPEGKKFELVMQEHQKVRAEMKVEEEFVESGAYSKLPTEAEVNEERLEESTKNNNNDEEFDKIQTENETSDDCAKDADFTDEENQNADMMEENTKEKTEKAHKKYKDNMKESLKYVEMYKISSFDDFMAFGDKNRKRLEAEA